MPIDNIIDELPSELRLRLEDDSKRARRMTGGSHLQDWLDYEVGLWGIRNEAMRIAHVNEPKGRGYNAAVAQLHEYYGLDKLDGHSLTAVLWLTDSQPKTKSGENYLTRKEILDGILKKMAPGERSRLSSPKSARQRVEKEIARIATIEQPQAADDDEPKFRPVDMERAIESVLHHLKAINDEDNRRVVIERIAGPQREDGDRFKPTDKADDIAGTLVRMFTRGKAKDIFTRGLAKLSAREPKAK